MLIETSSKRQYKITILIQNSYNEALHDREIPPEDHMELINAIQQDLEWQKKPLKAYDPSKAKVKKSPDNLSQPGKVPG